MIPGSLYQIRCSWAMPRGNDPQTGWKFWHDCGPILFIGEDVIHRDDGVKIVNYLVHVKGQCRLIDQTFACSYLEVIS